MRQLIANGQIATQYVDFNDNATYDIEMCIRDRFYIANQMRKIQY